MRHDRRVYAPPPGYVMYAPEPAEEQPRRQGLVFIVMFVALAAFSGFVWSAYNGASETPRIASPGAYKVQPGTQPQPTAEERSALNNVIEGRDDIGEIIARTTPELATPGQAPGAQPEAGATPDVRGAGPYVAQVAALQSEAAARDTWRGLAARAPDLFARAHMDVERADLGQRGTYWRVRAGYFADRTQASRFCERVRTLGADCIVAAR